MVAGCRHVIAMLLIRTGEGVVRPGFFVTICFPGGRGNKLLQMAATAETRTRRLVVDDAARLRDLLNRYLSEQGSAVRTVSDATEMNRRLARERYDRVTLDLLLPGEDGVAVCPRLRGGGENMPS